MSILFENVTLDNLLLKNPLVRSATWENKATEDGHMTPVLYDIYHTLAKEQVGLIITVGGFRDMETIESALTDFGVNAVGLSRPLLAEPNLFARWKKGQTAPAKCISCSRCRTPEGNYCTRNL